MTYAITGEYTGQVIKVGVTEGRAARYAEENGFVSYGREAQQAQHALEALAVGEAWKSHEDARGIKITRTA